MSLNGTGFQVTVIIFLWCWSHWKKYGMLSENWGIMHHMRLHAQGTWFV